MNTIAKIIVVTFGVTSLSGCATDPATRHEVACVGGTLAGAVIGAAIGNQFGGGSGNTIATAAGAAVGGATTATQMNC